MKQTTIKQDDTLITGLADRLDGLANAKEQLNQHRKESAAIQQRVSELQNELAKLNKELETEIDHRAMYDLPITEIKVIAVDKSALEKQFQLIANVLNYTRNKLAAMNQSESTLIQNIDSGVSGLFQFLYEEKLKELRETKIMKEVNALLALVGRGKDELVSDFDFDRDNEVLSQLLATYGLTNLR